VSVAYCHLFPTKAQNLKFSYQGALNTRSPTLPGTCLTYVSFLDWNEQRDVVKDISLCRPPDEIYRRETIFFSSFTYFRPVFGPWPPRCRCLKTNKILRSNFFEFPCVKIYNNYNWRVLNLNELVWSNGEL